MTPATAPLALTVVTPFGSLGGSERWLLGLLDTGGDRLAAEVVLLQDGPLRAELEARGVPVEVLTTGASGAAVARAGAVLARRLRRSGADVLLANGVKAAAVAVPAARWTGVPVAWMKHDFSLDATLARPLGRLADLVVANSAAVAEATGRADAVVIPPPRPATAPEPAAAAARFWHERGVPVGDGPTLAMVTRLVGYKGVDTAVAALAEPQAADWRLVVVGPEDPAEPQERARLLRLAAARGVADRVHLVGEVPDSGRWLAGFSAVAVLTRVDADGFGREGYSMVALEALAAEVPLVGARGNPEVERMAAAAGRVVDPADPAAVATALAELVDPAVRAEAAAAARRTLAAHPDARSCADEVVAALAGLAGRPGAGLVGPAVSVLTCFRNESGHVDEVVGRVLAQLGPDDEYLLLDDRSTDATRSELEEWAGRDHRVRLLTGPGINLSAARNHGFGEARHPVVVCTDAGVAPHPGWLAALRAAYAETDPVDLVVGVYEVDGGDPRRDAARLALFPAVAEARRRTPLVRLAGRLTGRRFDARRLDGRSMACSVAAWRAAGGFDVALYSSEDAVFGEQVLATGRRSALALDALVTWEQAPTVREMARMYAKYGEWGGRAGSRALVGRDLARGAAYVVAPLVALGGGRAGRGAVLAGAAGYLSVPVSRAVQERASVPTIALMPAMLAVKDVAKATGCLRGLAGRRRAGSPTGRS